MRAGALGDFVVTLPLLRGLRRCGRDVHLITRRSYASLLPPDLADIVCVDCDASAIAHLYDDSLESVSTELRNLFAGARVYLCGSVDTGLERNLVRLGVRDICWLDPRPKRPPHIAVQFLERAGMRPGTKLLDTPLWQGCGGGTGLWLHPGSGSCDKNCPPEFFAAVARRWQERLGSDVWVSFGEADMDVMALCREQLQRRGVTAGVVVRPSLPELRSLLLSRARVYVGNDSGVSHLAAASGVRTVAVFRTTDPRVWRPIGNCRVCRFNPELGTSTNVSQCWAAVEKLLDEQETGQGVS